jgi:excisionase family DNA binding protein
MAVIGYTTAVAAKEMGLSPRRVRELAQAGELKAYRVGRDWLIDVASAKNYRRRPRGRRPKE